MSKPLNRRQLIQGAFGSAISMGLARQLFANQEGGVKRLIIVMQNNGTQQANFWPNSAFTSPILEPILKHANLAAKTNIVRGLYVPGDANGTGGNGHDIGFARMFTGEKLVEIGGKPWGGGPSVDQMVAKAWNMETMTTAVLSSEVEPNPKPGFNHRRSFTYVAAGKHKEPTTDPYALYSAFFGQPSNGGSGQGASDQRLLLRRSVLDHLLGELKSLQMRLGAEEKAKLDIHLTAVRDMEKRLGAGGGQCSNNVKAPRNFTKDHPALLVNKEDAVPEMITNFLDLIVATLACDITRIATIQLGYGGGKWKFGWKDINENHHDDIAHKDKADEGSSKDITAKVVAINNFYAEQVAYLALALDAIPEGSGTMLDNSLIVWGNEMGRGNHSLSNVPLVLIGKASGYLPKGKRLISNGEQVFNRIGCTILNAMGIPSAGFGDERDCGIISGLV